MLSDQIALVTGASRGIGQAIAQALGAEKATVIGTATSAAGAENISATFNANGVKGTGMVLEPGMTFTIEPMINAGRRQTRLNQKDGWTVTTRDGRLSAQWEHTLGITQDGCEVFTRRRNESLYD